MKQTAVASSAARSRTLRALTSVLSDAFYRGSLLLLANTAVLAIFSFVFWALAARAYPAAAVGAFSGVTSGINLLASVASLGWPNTITRHLATARNATELVLVSTLAITTVGGALSVLVLLGLGSHLPAGLHLQAHGKTALLVTILVVFTAVGGLIDAGLVAVRSTQAVLIKNLLASIAKVAALFLLMRLGSSGLLLAYGGGLVLSTILSAATLGRRLGGRWLDRRSIGLLREHLSMTAANYLATIMGILPVTVVPLEVLIIRGPAQTARFSAAFMVAALLNFIPSTVARVLFAEASRAGVTLGAQLRKSLRGVYGLLLPVLLVVIAAAPLVLRAFGPAYAATATSCLRVLALSALLTGGTYLVDSALVARDRMTAYVVMNGVNAALVLGCVAALLPRGITAGAVGWALAQGISLVIGVVVLATGGVGRHRILSGQSDASQLEDKDESQIRQLLEAWPAMPTVLIAERLGWDSPGHSLLDRVVELRSAYLQPGQHLRRSRFTPGGMAQCGFWFPPVTVPVGQGQFRSAMELPVLTMITGYSRWLSAVLIPSEQPGDLFAAWWQLLAGLGAVPQLMTWDDDATVGQWRGGRSEPTTECRKFSRQLGTSVALAPAGDPDTRELIERAHAYLEGSFLPGRAFASPMDFNAQLDEWLAHANTRYRPAPNRSPAELIEADVQAMLPLPPASPTTIGWRLPVVVGQEPFVRFDGNHYSVHPAVTSRRVELIADLARVSVYYKGRLVASHPRSWAKDEIVGDPATIAIRGATAPPAA